jgi:DNA-binding transcriptional regulator YhcF (GntR family)
MQIPDKVKIGSLTIDISLVEHLIRDGKHMGCSCGNGCYIKIDNSIPEQQKHSTLIHEILELIDFIYELGLDHRTISTLESAIHQVIVDNPDMFKMT